MYVRLCFHFPIIATPLGMLILCTILSIVENAEIAEFRSIKWWYLPVQYSLCQLILLARIVNTTLTNTTICLMEMVIIWQFAATASYYYFFPILCVLKSFREYAEKLLLFIYVRLSLSPKTIDYRTTNTFSCKLGIRQNHNYENAMTKKVWFQLNRRTALFADQMVATTAYIFNGIISVSAIKSIRSVNAYAT